MILQEWIEEGKRLCRLLEEVQDEHRRLIDEAAEAEREYRKARALYWVSSTGTAKQKEAQVDARSADLRYIRDIKDGQVKATLEAQRNYRQQISLLQSTMATDRMEGELRH